MSKKKGFTLVEILVTVVILAVLAAIAIPNFSKSVSKAGAKQAAAYLRTIRTAEKMYYSKWGVYAPTLATGALIKTNLGAETNAKDFTFAVTNTGSGFTATATRTSTGGTISLNDAGSWSSTGTEETPID